MADILFVDDEKDLAAPLKDMLEEAGHTVELVLDGASALRRAQKRKFSLMIIDVELPVMKGHELCRELRKMQDCPPIVMLSYREDESTVVRGLECADDYVRRSCPNKELLLRIRNLLDRANDIEPESVIYAFANIELDLYRREVRRNGKPIHITSLENKLLLAFVRYPGKCWLRDDLLQSEWGGKFTTDRAVDQHMMNLREKIGQKYFVAVPGSGYRFDAKVTTKKV